MKLCPPFLQLFLFLFLSACDTTDKREIRAEENTKEDYSKGDAQRNISDEFKAYWYSDKAEITSYELMQERYGEIRKGTAVTIFITEDFLPEAQVKANAVSPQNISVMKLNRMKTFTTGVYPYSIMSSVFSPISKKEHALKVTTSAQEWCGQVYMQLNNKKNFEINSHSYFEGEADQKFSLKKTWLEDELWNTIRINPEEIPTGDITLIPSFEFIRMRHIPITEHKAFATLKQGDSLTSYTINYPDLQRQLTLFFRNNFPYEIEKWEEINVSRKNDTLRLKTSAVKLKSMRTDYWNKSKNEFSHLRDSLLLN